MEELLDALEELSEYELGGDWARRYNQVNNELRDWGSLSGEEQEFLMQRASYLVMEGNTLYREE